MSRATTGLNGDVADACKEQGQKPGLTGMCCFSSHRGGRSHHQVTGLIPQWSSPDNWASLGWLSSGNGSDGGAGCGLGFGLGFGLAAATLLLLAVRSPATALANRTSKRESPVTVILLKMVFSK